MQNKSLMFKTVNQVLKEVIIPELPDGMAKEQAVALISVLKNLDLWTLENIRPKEMISNSIKNTLKEQFTKLKNDSINLSSKEWMENLEASLKKSEEIEDITNRWNKLNEIQCQLFHHLYQEKISNPLVEDIYINPLRKKVREQLKIELSLVR